MGSVRPPHTCGLGRTGRAAGPKFFLVWDSSFDLRILLGALLEVYRATLHVGPISNSLVTAGAPAGRARAPRAAHLEREGRIAPDFKSNLWMMFRMLLHELSVTRGIMSAVVSQSGGPRGGVLAMTRMHVSVPE